jgi:hypothetical protein
MEVKMLQFKREGKVITITLEEEPKKPGTKCSLCGIERDKSKRRTKLGKPYAESGTITVELIKLITSSDSVCATCRASIGAYGSNLSQEAYDRSLKYNGPFLDYAFPEYGSFMDSKMYYVVPTDNGDFERKLEELGSKEFDEFEEYAEWNRVGAKVYEKYEEKREIAEEKQFEITVKEMIADGKEIEDTAAKFFLSLAKRQLRDSLLETE